MEVRRLVVTVSALVLAAAALVGCGGSGQSDPRVGDEARERGFEGRQVKIFALAKNVCEIEPRSETARNEGLPADASVVAIARTYAAEWPEKIRRAAFEGCLAGLGAVPARFPSSPASARDIWGRHFIVTSVVGKDDEDPPIARPIHIRVSFSLERDHNVGWQARCNSFGGDVRFTATTMEVGEVGGTLVGCVGQAEEEDEWLVDFMQAEPEWRLEGERLQLTSDSGTIVLRGPEAPNSCPVSPRGGRIDLGNAEFACEGALNHVTLYLEGKEGYLRGWECAESSAERSRLICRNGKKWFAVHDFDPALFGLR